MQTAKKFANTFTETFAHDVETLHFVPKIDVTPRKDDEVLEHWLGGYPKGLDWTAFFKGELRSSNVDMPETTTKFIKIMKCVVLTASKMNLDIVDVIDVLKYDSDMIKNNYANIINNLPKILDLVS